MWWFLAGLSALAVVAFRAVGARERAREQRETVQGLVSSVAALAQRLESLLERVGRLEAERAQPTNASHGAAAAEAVAMVNAPVAPRVPVRATTPIDERPVGFAPEGLAPEPLVFAPAIDASRSSELPDQSDWEAVVGGNWLNKAGVLVFVIGLSLFLGYSLTRLGPAGRVAVGWLAGLSLLGGGLAVERRPAYALFARGLVAGGWAACYFTAFAMFALPAARVIDGPLAGTALLLVVAGAMIAHSLRYRAQTVTALTYVIGFVTLHITPATGFTLLGSVPLAVSLLTVSYRYRWTALSTVGVLSTYAGFVVRLASSGQPASLIELQTAEAMLLTYWLLFEFFDLLEVRRQTGGGLARSLFFLNATGFVGTSMLLWSGQPARSLSLLLALTAILYVASSLVRARLQRGVPRDDEATGLDAAWSGGYETAITMAASLAALAIGLGFAGNRLVVALLLEGQLLLMSGLRLQSRYLRGLASLVLIAASAGALAIISAPRQGTFELLGHRWHDWLPTVALTAAAVYLNVRLVRHRRPALAEVAYLALGTGLVALIVVHETPLRFQTLAWLALSLALLEASIQSGVAELRRHAYVVGAFSVLVCTIAWSRDGSSAWQLLASSALIAYALAIRCSGHAAGIEERERELSGTAASWVAAGLSIAAITSATPRPYAGLAWLVFAWPLAEIGLTRWRACAIQAGVIGTAATVHTFMEAGLPGPSAAEHASLLLAGLGGLTGLAAVRFSLIGDGNRSDQRAMRDVCACISVAALTVLAPHAFDAVFVAAAWALFGLLLMTLNRLCRFDGLRFLAYLLGALGFARGWLLVVEDHEPWSGVPVRLIAATVVVATLYAQEFLVPRHWRNDRSGLWIDRHARDLYSAAATLLGSVLLFRETSSAMVTATWALLGLALLTAGFPAREPVLRRSGLVLLTVCVVKVLAYDSRELETLARIVSFMLLGVVLITVSWVYTRFGQRLRGLL